MKRCVGICLDEWMNEWIDEGWMKRQVGVGMEICVGGWVNG